MTTIEVPPDVRDWLDREAHFLGISLDALVVEYLTDAVLAKKAAARLSQTKKPFVVGAQQPRRSR